MARNEPSDSVVLSAATSVSVVTGPCIVLGVIAAAAATTCAVELYDSGSTTTTGTTNKVVLNALAGGSEVFHSDGGIVFSNGCTAVVSGTGAKATIVFAKI